MSDSMSVDELDEMLMDLIADAIDFGHRDYSGPVREENERRDDYQELHKAKQAIHQYVTKKLVEEWKKACIDNWQCPIPEQYALDRIKELEKQLKTEETHTSKKCPVCNKSTSGMIVVYNYGELLHEKCYEQLKTEGDE